MERIDGIVIEESIAAIVKEIMIDIADPSPTAITEIAGKTCLSGYMDAILIDIEKIRFNTSHYSLHYALNFK